MILVIRNEFSISGRNGYPISVLSNVKNEHSSVLLCLHGFCGDKNSSVIAALMEALDQIDVGVTTFDWPAHGNSAAKDEDLTVENCLSDLETVIDLIRREWALPISCFATSFGGYLAMLYRSEHLDTFEETILRSPALKMPQIFMGFLSKKERAHFLGGDPVTMGFDRKMQLTVSFYESLASHLVYDAPVCNPDSVLILQGDCDDTVMPEDTAEYADRNHIRIEWFCGSDHRYKAPGDLERIVDVSRMFLLSCGDH